MQLRDRLQELRELGLRGTTFRIGWELKLRSGIAGRSSVPEWLGPLRSRLALPADQAWTRRLPFADAPSVADALADRLPAEAAGRLEMTAREALQGRILAFGRWTADYGQPIDWHRNPASGKRWDPSMPWTRVYSADHGLGDVKLTWEVGRFPHAYHLARAAAHTPAASEPCASGLATQLQRFCAENPFGLGVHWASGQELVFRLMAWLFAYDALLSRTGFAADTAALLADSLLTGAAFVAEHIDYARLAVYNNHLLSEALGLFITGVLFAEDPHARQWAERGRGLLDEQVDRQVYPDGGYIQQSHNYHRVALQILLWACAFSRAHGERPSAHWHRAMERSLDLLVAHQNPLDGRLPNYGSNDGALPSLLSCCDYSDFRPTLQAVSLETRGVRLYEPGPWDEEAAWFHGPLALESPLERPTRKSVSFGETGYHVLRSAAPTTFSTFRCGTIHDRFSQIDMLHLDVWWRGHNVLVDAGSYLYNDSHVWHSHFLRTESHNTLSLDGRDQMLHFRRFKSLYWTQAALLSFEPGERTTVAAGEHYGYRRHPGGCVHRRGVLFFEPDLWVVIDSVSGTGEHDVRLHWLGGPFPWQAVDGGMSLQTPEGSFHVRVYDHQAHPLPGDVVAGQEPPPRGWLSRYYAEKVPVPSLAVRRTAGAPLTWVSILGPCPDSLVVEGAKFRVGQNAFTIRDGIPRPA